MPEQAEALAQGLVGQGIPVCRLATNIAGRTMSRWVDSLRVVRALVRWLVFLARLGMGISRCHVLHIFSCSGLSFFLFTLPPLLLGHVLGKRVIVHYHGGGAATFFGRMPWLIPVLKCADVVLVPSQFLLRIFRNMGVSCRIIPNVLDLRKFPRKSSTALKPDFIVARHLEPDYNVEAVLRGFAIVHNHHAQARLLILGTGRQEAELKRLAEDLGVSGAVRFLGYIENNKIGSIYAQCSIFLNMSRVDNLPVSILEAWAVGLPVITSAAGGIPDLVEHGRSGLLVDLDDHEDLARRIFQLLETPGMAERLVANGREEVQRYTWPLIFQQLSDVYELRPHAATCESSANRGLDAKSSS
jgi:glycosyltransferase involved in cell wall biosynthesis